MNYFQNNTAKYEIDSSDYINSIEELEQILKIAPGEKKLLKKITERHPMRITSYYLSLIKRNDPYDPIRKMSIPSKEEFNMSGTYDTSGEAENTIMPGLQHKYKQTALILATNRCEMYCRYCFRKRLVGLPSEEIISRFEKAVEYINEHKEINNVLISGGDPFTLSTDMIIRFIEKLIKIEHLIFIRFGSRIPVTRPDRIYNDDRLLSAFKKYSGQKQLYLSTQINHEREITKQSYEAISRLADSNVIINNQSVLLKGVNDDPDLLSRLLNRLVGIGVNPYYVFQCRPVRMVKNNFQVSLKRGCEITEKAKGKCNGLSKRFKYVMSHKTGKIEILGIMGENILLKYLQAKNNDDIGKLLKKRITDNAGWFDELE